MKCHPKLTERQLAAQFHAGQLVKFRDEEDQEAVVPSLILRVIPSDSELLDCCYANMPFSSQANVETILENRVRYAIALSVLKPDMPAVVTQIPLRDLCPISL